MSRNEFLKTQFSVHDGEKTYPVHIDPVGMFVVIHPSLGGEMGAVRKPSLAELNEHFERAAARTKAKQKAKVKPVEITFINRSGWNEGDHKLQHGTITGLPSDRSRRIMGSGIKGLDWYAVVYRRFTEADVAEYTRLQQAAVTAKAAVEKFLKARSLGDAGDVATKLDKQVEE